jgi:Tfp pilus assembly protein PilE
MDRGVLNKKGLTLLETAATMLVIVFILSMVIPNNVQRIQNSKFQKTVAEMKTIAEAAIDYYISQNSCPMGIGTLAPTYLQQAVVSSPFLSSYQLSCMGNMVSVSNLIPAGLVQKNPEGSLLQVIPTGMKDNIIITKLIPNSFTGRLNYDKKYLYGGS